MDDVLIVGAGPTGLMAAVWLAANGVRARIVDPKPGPTPETRAVTLQARTLELWKPLGLVERALARGLRAEATDAWVGGRLAARIPLVDIGKDLSPYPFVLLLPQSETEAILYDRLRELGGEVEWGTRLVELQPGRVVLASDRSETPETAEFRFVLGCDGASSAVRKATGFGFPGGTYEGRFFVADLTASGGVVPKEVNLAFGRDRFFVFFPLKEENRWRIAGRLPGESPTEDDMRAEVEREMRTTIGDVRWFSHYRVHHRVVERFRQGPVFLLGDAAHVHSPVGGQGMNTGLGDAINLAWKLVEVLRHGADERLLDSYEAERRPFARTLVNTTDRAFTFVVARNPLARFVRLKLLPMALALALRASFARRLVFLTVSQTRIAYRKGPLAGSRSAGFVAGDRLPGDAPGVWTLVVGTNRPEIDAWCARQGIPPLVEAAPKGSTLLVRPDGHIGLALDRFEPEALDRYLKDVIGRR